jgi:hypothetical protein
MSVNNCRYLGNRPVFVNRPQSVANQNQKYDFPKSENSNFEVDQNVKNGNKAQTSTSAFR